MRGTPASRGQSFIARDHRYVYLGGSVIALVGLSLWYSAPSPYSFLPAGSVPVTDEHVNESYISANTHIVFAGEKVIQHVTVVELACWIESRLEQTLKNLLSQNFTS